MPQRFEQTGEARKRRRAMMAHLRGCSNRVGSPLLAGEPSL
jgi:hypothetical protein